VLDSAVAERLACVDAYLACLGTAGAAMPTHPEKGRCQTYLAGLPGSPKTLVAATRGEDFDWGSPAFAELADWLRRLVSSTE
jgi:hypothetical protein